MRKKKALYTAGIYLLVVGAAGVFTGCIDKENHGAAAPVAPNTQASEVQEEMSLSVTLKPVDSVTVEDSVDVIIRGPEGKVKGQPGFSQKVDLAQNPPF